MVTNQGAQQHDESGKSHVLAAKDSPLREGESNQSAPQLGSQPNARSTDPASIQMQVVSIDTNTSVENVLGALNRLEFFERFIRELRSELDERLIAWIELHGPIECGPIRYYVGPKRTTKCLDKRQTVEATLSATGGDLNRFCEVLVAQPFKYGSAKTLLPAEECRRCFITIEEPELREGKPSPRLQRVDTRFWRPDPS